MKNVIFSEFNFKYFLRKKILRKHTQVIFQLKSGSEIPIIAWNQWT